MHSSANRLAKFPRLLGILFVTAIIGLNFAPLALAKKPHGAPTAKVQTGKATYYGPRFHGKKTASGRRFNQHELVAAHPSLPFGTVARVTNLENGRAVKVNVIDRGPAKRIQKRGVVIDLSTAAAKKLGFIKQGKTKVRIDVLKWGGIK